MNKTNIFLTAALALAIAWALLSMKSCSDRSNDSDVLRTAMKAYQDSTKHYRNRYNQVVASREQVVVRGKDADLFINRDSLAKRFNTKAGNIEGYTKITSKTDATIKPDTIYEPVLVYLNDKDCPEISYWDGSFSNPYYKANVRLGEGAYLNIKSYDTTSIVQKRGKSGGLFNRRYFSQIDVINANPDAVVENVEAYRIYDEPRNKSFSVFGQAGAGFFPSSSTLFYLGAGAEVKFKRLSIQGSYNKAPDYKSFIDIRARFDLIKL